MELTRRGTLGGLAAVCGIGAVGFVGASSVEETVLEDDGSDPAGATDPDAIDGDPDAESRQYVDVDPDAPFEARLEGPDVDERLFTATDLEHVEGVYREAGDYLVVIALQEHAVADMRGQLAEQVDDPAPFDIWMTLDDDEVRRIDLDDSRYEALIGDTWKGTIVLPFTDETIANAVYDALGVE